MFEFVVIEDMKQFNDKIVKIINSFIIQCKLNADIKSFFDYTDEVKEIIKSRKNFKIYILDIMLPSENGVSIANFIRTVDYDSIIIFLTDYYNETYQYMLEGKIMYLKFISKKSDYEKELIELFKEIVHNPRRKEIITINTKGMLYRFQSKDIVYVIYCNRKTKIVTDYNDIYTSKSLTEVFNLFDSRFIYSHKSCFINTDRITLIDKKNRIIHFDNGYSTDVVSEDQLRKIIKVLK